MITDQMAKYRLMDWFIGALAALFMGAAIYQGIMNVRDYFNPPEEEAEEESGKGKLNRARAKLESGKSLTRLTRARVESGKSRQVVPKTAKIESMQEKVTKAFSKIQRTPQEQEIFEAEMQAWKAENAADLAIQMRRNQMHLYFEVAETGNLLDLPPINVLFIRGRDMLINKHYVTLFDKYVSICNIVLKKVNAEVGLKFDAKQVFDTQRGYKRAGEDTDLIVMTFPKTLPTFRDLTKHVMEKSYLGNLSGNRIVMTFPGEPWVQKFGEVARVAAQSYRNFENERLVAETIISNIGSADGDCGAAYILDEPSVQRRLVGFHYAGLKGAACAVPLVLEDLLEVLTPIKYQEIETAALQAPPVFTNSTAQYLGVVHPAPANPAKSKIVRTQIFDIISESKVKPAHLFASLYDERSPMYKGIQKQFTQQAMIDPVILEKATLDYANHTTMRTSVQV